MDRANIEKLGLWLVVAIAIQLIVSRGASLFIHAQQNAAFTDAERIHTLAIAAQYYEAYQVIFGLLINLVISIWLFRQANAKKYLWAALGLFAKWWALPIFAWWVYLGNQSKNT